MYSQTISSPSAHNPENFVYLVSGVMDSHTIPVQEAKERFERKIQIIQDPNQFYRGTLIGELSQERLNGFLGEVRIL